MKRGRVPGSVKAVERRAVILWDVWGGFDRWSDWRDVKLMMWEAAETLRLLGHDEAAEDAEFIGDIAEALAVMAVVE